MWKKVFRFIKSLFVETTTVTTKAKQAREVKSFEYWNELAEHVRMEERVVAYHEEQREMARQEFRAWAENNRMVHNYFNASK